MTVIGPQLILEKRSRWWLVFVFGIIKVILSGRIRCHCFWWVFRMTFLAWPNLVFDIAVAISIVSNLCPMLNITWTMFFSSPPIELHGALHFSAWCEISPVCTAVGCHILSGALDWPPGVKIGPFCPHSIIARLQRGSIYNSNVASLLLACLLQSLIFDFLILRLCLSTLCLISNINSILYCRLYLFHTSIPDICHFLYATALFKHVKSMPKSA